MANLIAPIALAVFAAVFVLDVVLGAMGNGSILDDVQEMVVLFAASLAFVVIILRREAQAKSKN